MILLAASLVTSAAAEDAVMMAGRQKSTAFMRGDDTAIWAVMTPEMREVFGTLSGLTRFRTELEHGHGLESEVLEEKTRTDSGKHIYQRTVRLTKSANPILMQWTFDPDMKIAGFFVRPVPVPAETRFLAYRTKASLRLPFENEWFVFWGGRSLDQNYHIVDKAQRFASDFLVRKDGVTHSGNPADLRSYFCWGRSILSPAAGTVIAAVDGFKDQPIGRSDPGMPAGNHVVLDFGHGEFAFLAHLQQGSVTVKAGEIISAGQELGRCGNSGNTSEPHLHFHLQTTPHLESGEGLPAFFRSYLADGRLVESGEPVQGQFVSPNAD